MIVQQQAIRDHSQAMVNFFAGTHRCPSWRKAGRDEGFRIVAVKPGHVRRLSRNVGRRFDVIRVENLKIRNMTRSAKGSIGQPGRNVAQKAGLNREILRSGWGLLARRLEDKAPGRVQRVNPAFTSQRCSACGHIAAGSRESQALFHCVACGHTLNADVNAAINIAAGHAVTARGGSRLLGPGDREPQPVLLPAT
ncbi:MAG TPA: zinc ribbon domain-containing protein [Streptosporangiaceae bacterium]|nr:zinc ribbon domain-containing protein [Streptosporangiaceae bacterium]